MIILKKSEIVSLLLTISAYDTKTQKMVSGLLSENLTLGTKRKLQKIHKEVSKQYQELQKDLEDIEKEVKDEKKKEQELKELMDEEIKIGADKIQFSFLENVSTNSMYDFEIIDKITE